MEDQKQGPDTDPRPTEKQDQNPDQKKNSDQKPKIWRTDGKIQRNRKMIMRMNSSP